MGSVGTALTDIARKAGGEGHVAMVCPRCQRHGAILLRHLQDHCRQRLIREDWKVAIQLFRCGGCGRRPVKVYYSTDPPPAYCIVPLSIGVPLGVSPRAWHNSSEDGRKRLVRQARG